jgi:type IV pilus assembly protein PilY1
MKANATAISRGSRPLTAARVVRHALRNACVLTIATLLILSPLTGQAAQLTLSTTPLFLSTPVEPNVMLLIDDSGSMNNIIWASGYDNTTSYTHWGTTDWSATNGNVWYSNINECSSPSGYKEGSDGTTTKCLKLPDPVTSGATRYTGNYLNYLFNTYANNTDLTLGLIPTDYRMNVARNVATNLVNTTTGVRFGVSHFYE